MEEGESRHPSPVTVIISHMAGRTDWIVGQTKSYLVRILTSIAIGPREALAAPALVIS